MGLGLVAAALAPSAAVAAGGSLYKGAAPRPGPDILYAPVVTAPPLTNNPTRPWVADPILISGATAYRQGEFLYQDWLYDDRGGAGGGANRDSGEVRNGAAPQTGGNGGEDLINPSFGTYTYPQDRAVYAENAADLVELRVKPGIVNGTEHMTGFRVTLNTLTQAAVQKGAVAITIAMARCPSGTCPATTHAFPHGAHASAPADYFFTMYPGGLDLRDGNGVVLDAGVSNVYTDQPRHQIDAQLNRTAWNPGTDTWRITAGVGLYDTTSGNYLIPQTNADNTRPGGLGNLDPTKASAFYNIAFRDTRQTHGNSEAYHPLNTWASPNGALAEPTFWRDYSQGLALRDGTIGAFHADVSFSKLAAATNDDSQVPPTGPMDRIFSSHWQLGEGVNFNQGCSATSPNPCPAEYLGQLQPFAVYVPLSKPASGYGMTLLPHSLSGSYNQYFMTTNQSAYAERDGTHTSIVITTEDRGPDGWYHGLAGADPFEAWADIASRYQLDPAFTDIGGYSMGGYATYKFATQYPDLFAMAHSTVGPPAVGIWIPPNAPTGGASTNTNRMLPSLRNVPFLMWNSYNDELVPYPGTQVQANNDPSPLATALTQATSFDALGYRYQFSVFAMPPGMGHLGLALHDNFAPGGAFLGATKVDRDPPHVTYVRNPTMDYSPYGTTADHAYWLSLVKLRDGTGAAPIGTIDVRSEGFGVGDATSGATQVGGGVLTGSIPGCCVYDTQSRTWGAAPAAPVKDVLDIDAKNVRDVTVNTTRARVTCNAALHITSDGPLTVHLASCGRDVEFVPAGGGGLPDTATSAQAGLPIGLGLAAFGVAAAARRRRRGRAHRAGA